MSSIIHAYYLKSYDQTRAVSLLDRAGVGGYVWPAANGWVPLVVGSWARDKALIGALEEADALLSYTVVEGRGWSFELLSREKCFLRYARSWAPREKIDHELFDENARLLARLMADHNPRAFAGKAEAELIALLRSALFPAASAGPQEASHRVFASFLGLCPADGLFYDELPSDIASPLSGVVRVPPRGRRR